MQQIRKAIQAQLPELEQKENIRILYACEAGSRAWGFPSPDSDYDVRFIYILPENKYLGIDEPKDNLNCMAGELDFAGWELRKSLLLMRKSNAVLFEWLNSPIIYQQDEAFVSNIMQIASDYFSPRPGLYHYLSMATKYLAIIQKQPDVKLKTLFYMLRTSLAATWIAEYSSIPPMELKQLLVLVREPQVKKVICELLVVKQQQGETFTCRPGQQLLDYCSGLQEKCKTVAEKLPQHRGNTALLNDLFRESLSLWN